jgi:hypothetical protein
LRKNVLGGTLSAVGASIKIEAGVYNTWTFICHRLSCQALSNANTRNLKPVESWAQAVELGLKACHICHPDEKPPIGSVMIVLSPTGEVPTIDLGNSPQPSVNSQVAANERRIAALQHQLDERRISELQRRLNKAETAEKPPAPPVNVQLPPADITDWRRRIVQAIARLDQGADRQPQESVAARLGRLSRQGVIPRSIVAQMRAITEMRNAVEYESKALSFSENVSAWANWNVIQEWASKEGLQL